MQKPVPPYWTVIFSSELKNDEGYGAMAERMVAMAREQPGFLGVESARDPSGLGITVSYWQSREDIAAWGQVLEHRAAQDLGHRKWYRWYRLRIAHVDEERRFGEQEGV
ncbi:MAG: antibiotic biosynthesis monooxygenase family protein [Planctomycetota bacterium]|jgi:heme-degrading monooxygenase HmoA